MLRGKFQFLPLLVAILDFCGKTEKCEYLKPYQLELYAKGKDFNFRHFWRPSRIFAGKQKSVNISKTIRDRAISSEFLTHRVVQ